jgi:hypothetical protein
MFTSTSNPQNSVSRKEIVSLLRIRKPLIAGSCLQANLPIKMCDRNELNEKGV